jgi:aldose 1-epimerase
MSSVITVRQLDWGTVDSADTNAASTPVHRYLLSLPNGTEVALSNLGASMLHWLAPDRHGQCANILLGFETPSDYLASSTHMGGVIGRWANRIANARFTLDGQEHRLEANDGPHSLHGGSHGFDRVVWQAELLDDGVRFSHVSPDGDAGFPGQVTLTVTYRLDADGALTLRYHARSTAATPLNLTCHPYFNLAATGTALDHVVEIDADHFLAADASGIPTARESVEGTPLDFREGATVRARLESADPRIRAAHGIDHCFILAAPDQRESPLRRVANLFDPASGRELTVLTTERGLQFYTAGNLEGVAGKAGLRHRSYDALCFEAQAWPNQINMPEAEAVTLRPGKDYTQTTVYRPGVRPEEVLEPETREETIAFFTTTV